MEIDFLSAEMHCSIFLLNRFGFPWLIGALERQCVRDVTDICYDAAHHWACNLLFIGTPMPATPSNFKIAIIDDIVNRDPW